MTGASRHVAHHQAMAGHPNGLITHDVARRFVTLGVLRASPERHGEKLKREQPQQKLSPTTSTFTHGEKIAPRAADYQLTVLRQCP